MPPGVLIDFQNHYFLLNNLWRRLDLLPQEVQTEDSPQPQQVPQHDPDCPFNTNTTVPDKLSEPPSENSDDYLDYSEVKVNESFVPENNKSIQYSVLATL